MYCCQVKWPIDLLRASTLGKHIRAQVNIIPRVCSGMVIAPETGHKYFSTSIGYKFILGDNIDKLKGIQYKGPVGNRKIMVKKRTLYYFFCITIFYRRS